MMPDSRLPIRNGTQCWRLFEGVQHRFRPLHITPKYAIAICLCEKNLLEVKLLKDQLYYLIDWYNSRNSDGHITIKSFHTLKKLREWEYRLQAFCLKQKPFEVIFSSVASFEESGTLYLAADFESNIELIRLSTEFFGKPDKSFKPHISIARGLTPNQLEFGKKLFEGRKFDIRFTIGNIAIRKFNNEREQYDVYKRFSFGDSL